VYADHSQFYVSDPDADVPDGLVWDGAALERRLAAPGGFVAVGTIGYTFLPVVIEVWDEEPPLDLEAWDHVVEGPLETRSGRLRVGDLDEAERGLDLEPGRYRVRSAAGGLAGADELNGGDRYRVQLWPEEPAPPEVRKWWPPWDPANVAPRPTTAGGRLLVGAEADDARMGMSWLASRGAAHLFRDPQGTLWEHSNLPDASGTPQLEELERGEAQRRYGAPESWGTELDVGVASDRLGAIFESIGAHFAEPSDGEPARDERGRRVLEGVGAALLLGRLRASAGHEGDVLYRDEDGAYWELSAEKLRRGVASLTELSPDDARAKYGDEI
jgi:hypothetical protein